MRLAPVLTETSGGSCEGRCRSRSLAARSLSGVTLLPIEMLVSETVVWANVLVAAMVATSAWSIAAASRLPDERVLCRRWMINAALCSNWVSAAPVSLAWGWADDAPFSGGGGKT